MDFANILFQMHVQQSISESPPFKINIENISIDDLDFSKINSFTNENIYDFSRHCFDIYKKRYPNSLYGSVDINPTIWTQILIRNLSKIKPFELPNGCCNQPSCSINMFYKIILEELLIVHRVIN